MALGFLFEVLLDQFCGVALGRVPKKNRTANQPFSFQNRANEEGLNLHYVRIALTVKVRKSLYNALLYEKKISKFGTSQVNSI